MHSLSACGDLYSCAPLFGHPHYSLPEKKVIVDRRITAEPYPLRPNLRYSDVKYDFHFCQRYVGRELLQVLCETLESKLGPYCGL